MSFFLFILCCLVSRISLSHLSLSLQPSMSVALANMSLEARGTHATKKDLPSAVMLAMYMEWHVHCTFDYDAK